MRSVIAATIMHLAVAVAVAGPRLAWIHCHLARTVVDDHGKAAADHGAAWWRW